MVTTSGRGRTVANIWRAATPEFFIGGYVVSFINNFVATCEQPEHKIISVRSQAPIEEGSGRKGALEVIVLPRHVLAATVAVSVIMVVLCSTVVVASLAAWSVLN